ncbi:MAG: hypothetical protein IIY78_08995, partial [Clostridia bacterium]|nr:hypothetical protein [Clostridia bacterium]
RLKRVCAHFMCFVFGVISSMITPERCPFRSTLSYGFSVTNTTVKRAGCPHRHRDRGSTVTETGGTTVIGDGQRNKENKE